MAQVLRVGVLGAGWAGTGHAAAYRHLPDVEVCALWSRSSDRAEALASTLDSPRLHVYQEWQELITRGRCDVISIATAPMLRSAPFLLALEYGCHVLVEKPMSVGVGEAADMVAAAERSSTVTACCFNWRYAPALQAAKRDDSRRRARGDSRCAHRMVGSIEQRLLSRPAMGGEHGGLERIVGRRAGSRPG